MFGKTFSFYELKMLYFIDKYVIDEGVGCGILIYSFHFWICFGLFSLLSLNSSLFYFLEGVWMLKSIALKVVTRYTYDVKCILLNAKSINCDLYIILPAHAYCHLGTYMIFIKKIYDPEIRSGKFDQEQRQLG